MSDLAKVRLAAKRASANLLAEAEENIDIHPNVTVRALTAKSALDELIAALEHMDDDNE